MRLPIVIRIPYAGGISGVERHRDSSEAYCAHAPGLKVFTPATVEDACLMLRETIDPDDPAVFVEPRKLYWSEAPVDLAGPRKRYERRETEHRQGRAVVARAGEDATILTCGLSVPTAPAAATAATGGRSFEVVDLRSIVPFDDETVAASVRRTGRVVFVAEAPASRPWPPWSWPVSGSAASTRSPRRCAA